MKLRVCLICGQGIKPARGWTWVSPYAIFFRQNCPALCPVFRSRGIACHWLRAERAGLIWIGRTFYPTVEAFEREADRQGVCRRIGAVPRGFKVGETWVLLGHRKACRQTCPACEGKHTPEALNCEECGGKGVVYDPGIFRAFKPTAIEKVVTKDTPQEELEKLTKRGITPVIVERDEDQTTLGGIE